MDPEMIQISPPRLGLKDFQEILNHFMFKNIHEFRNQDARNHLP